VQQFVHSFFLHQVYGGWFCFIYNRDGAVLQGGQRRRQKQRPALETSRPPLKDRLQNCKKVYFFAASTPFCSTHTLPHQFLFFNTFFRKNPGISSLTEKYAFLQDRI
jgi:hypothetical protein